MIVGAYETRLQDSAAEAADLRQALASLQQEHRTLENRQAAQMQRIAAASNLVSVMLQCSTAPARSALMIGAHDALWCAYDTRLRGAVQCGCLEGVQAGADA